MKPGNWWRAQNTCVHHAKLVRLNDKAHRNWFNLNCIANAHGGVLPDIETVATDLRVSVPRAAAAIAEMVAKKLFDRREDGSFVPHDWDEWQFKTDTVDPTNAERQKRHRDKRNAALRNGVTDVTIKRPEAEAEQKQSTTEARAVISGSEGKGEQSDIVVRVLKTDLMEAFGEKRCPDLARAALWIEKGYAPAMVVDVVREQLARKPDIVSLAYFESMLAERHAKRPPTPSERAAGMTGEALERAVGLFAKTGHWSRQAGPEPGQSGCKASPEMLAKHGIGADGEKLRVSA